jgi:hypothetical protein
MFLVVIALACKLRFFTIGFLGDLLSAMDLKNKGIGRATPINGT